MMGQMKIPAAGGKKQIPGRPFNAALLSAESGCLHLPIITCYFDGIFMEIHLEAMA